MTTDIQELLQSIDIEWVLDREGVEVRWQSEWFGSFTLGHVFRLAATTTVAQLLARDDFRARFDSGQPLAVVELLYPLLQAHDSVAVQADVELGGTKIPAMSQLCVMYASANDDDAKFPDPRRLDIIRETLPALKRITAADVQRVAQTYLSETKAWKAIVTPASKPH